MVGFELKSLRIQILNARAQIGPLKPKISDSEVIQVGADGSVPRSLRVVSALEMIVGGEIHRLRDNR